MTNTQITRISADYRHNGWQRAVIGFDYEAANNGELAWTVEVGNVSEPFLASSFVVTDIHRFASDVEAARWSHSAGYR